MKLITNYCVMNDIILLEEVMHRDDINTCRSLCRKLLDKYRELNWYQMHLALKDANCALRRSEPEYDDEAHGEMNPHNWLLLLAARAGKMEFCMSLLAQNQTLNPDWMLQGGASGGHRDICIRAFELIRESDCGGGLDFAAQVARENGHANIDKLLLDCAFEWNCE